MVKRRKKVDECNDTNKKCTDNDHDLKCADVEGSDIHYFQESETESLRQKLLEWYDNQKRDLPWRRKAQVEDANERAYAVWVSEVMLQQTQVATVIDYYNKWMEKWPTLEKLAEASLESVNEMWSGLGYYSRGRRLQEGAHKVVHQLNGQMPKCAADLQKQLPGVGRYTAGAIASIAFNEVTGLVDGNVVRVLSRMRLIGGESVSQPVVEALWSIANKIVDTKRPGDFNQAMMELGATVCTPKSPSCNSCPVRSICKAFSQVEIRRKEAAKKFNNGPPDGIKKLDSITDIECLVEDCKLCLPAGEPWDQSLGVMNYPRKPKKKAPREERTTVCVLQRKGPGENTEYLIVQRPETGLLAGLWEFPNMLQDSDSNEKQQQILSRLIEEKLDLKLDESWQSRHVAETYVIDTVSLPASVKLDLLKVKQPAKWVTKAEFLESAISTAMKKVFRAVDSPMKPASQQKAGKRKRESAGVSTDGKKQLALEAFFKPTAKK